MATGSKDHGTWSKPLLTWIEIFVVPLFMGAQLVVFLILCFVPPSSFYKPPPPGQAFELLILNGLVGIPVLLWCCFLWLGVKKYSRWIVACDPNGLTVTTHKNHIHQMPWSKYKGYVICLSPRKQIKVLSDDGALDFAVPFRGFHDVHETTHRLLLTMDPRIPVGGTRIGRDEPPIRVPRWLAWALVVASVPLFGMPVWVLWLNGFAAAPGLLFELFSRFGGLIWPCILSVPVIFFVGFSSMVETKRHRSQDTTLPPGVQNLVRSFPANRNSSKAFQIVLVGFLLFIAFTIAAMARDQSSLVPGALLIAVAISLSVGAQRELDVSRRRVLVTSTHLVVRQGKKEWCWPNGEFEVSLEHGTGKFGGVVRRIKVRHDATELTLLERWADGDWLSRSLETASKSV